MVHGRGRLRGGTPETRFTEGQDPIPGPLLQRPSIVIGRNPKAGELSGCETGAGQAERAVESGGLHIRLEACGQGDH